MKPITSTFHAAVFAIIAASLGMTSPVRLLADNNKYTLADLQALDHQKAWEELLNHIEDVPPSQRNAQWSQLVKDGCLSQPVDAGYWEDSWFVDDCSVALKSAMGVDPTNDKLAWDAGKWSVHSKAWANAVPFFARAVQKPGDARCSDPDLNKAVVAGLHLSPGDGANRDYIKDSQQLAFTTCWPASKQAILDAFSSHGGAGVTPGMIKNSCDSLRQKGALSGVAQQQCGKAQNANTNNYEDKYKIISRLRSTPASEQNAEWGQQVAEGCLLQQPYDAEFWKPSWVLEDCLMSLIAAVKVDPSNTKLAWNAGKWAIKTTQPSYATYFFGLAIQNAGDAKCKDPDVIASLASGFSLIDVSSDERLIATKRLAFNTCWPASKPGIEKAMAITTSPAHGHVMRNACPGLREKGALTPDQKAQCDKGAPEKSSHH